MPRKLIPSRRRRRFRPGPALDRLEGRELMAFAGSLDPTFGAGTGYDVSPTLATAGLTSFGASVAVEPDGSVVVAVPSGGGQASYAVTRLKPDGTPDTSFGTSGVASIPLPSGVPAVTGGPSALLTQPDGKIIVVGTGFVARLDASGSPDPTFGIDGVEVLDQATLGVVDPALPYAALQSNGDLVLAGYQVGPGTAARITVARLDASGSPDPTFGTNGVVALADTAQGESADAVAVQPNGQVVVLADTPMPVFVGEPLIYYTPALIRLNVDGSEDSSLSQAGITSSGVQLPNLNGLIVQPNGQLLVLGAFYGSMPIAQYYVARLNADGSLDKSTTVGKPGNGDVSSFALQQDGKIVLTGVGGAYPATFSGNFTITRLDPDLTPDPLFGQGGTSTVSVPVPAGAPGPFTPASLAAGPNDQVIVAGTNPTTSPDGMGILPTNFVVARLTATGTTAHPGDFTGDGIADPAAYLPTYGAFAIADSSGKTPGQIVPFGTAGEGQQTIPAPGDYYGTGQDDIAAYLTTLGVYAVADPTGQTSGKLIAFGSAGPGQTLPAPGDYYGTGQDDIAVYLAAAGAFAIVDPTGRTSGMVIPFGVAGVGNAIPAPGDYFGTGHDDLALYLPTLGAFAIADPAGKVPAELIPFGGPGYGNAIPMPGDYDGSGRTELAVYLPALGEIVYRPAGGGNDVDIPFGGAGAGAVLPAAADYTGSGRTDPAVYIPALGELAYRPPTGPDVYIKFGIPGPGQTIPVTPAPLSQFHESDSGLVFMESIAEPGVGGGYDPLDFVPAEASKKAKGGGSNP